MFADAYGKPIGIGLWLNKRLLLPRYGIDLLYQSSAFGFLAGLILLFIVFVTGVDGTGSSRAENLAIYLACLLLSLGLSSYLTAAKISTIRSLSSR